MGGGISAPESWRGESVMLTGSKMEPLYIPLHNVRTKLDSRNIDRNCLCVCVNDTLWFQKKKTLNQTTGCG